MRTNQVLTAISALVLTASAHAVPVVLDATDSGFINALGRTSTYDGTLTTPATFNYSAGAIDDAPLGSFDVPRKNYFTFDLSGIAPGSVVDATLSLFSPAPAPAAIPPTPGGYDSPDAFEEYVLGGTFASPSDMADFASDLTKLLSPFVPGEAAEAMGYFDALAETLGGGDVIGAVIITDADDGTTIDIDFTPFGVDYLNTFAGGVVVIGGLVPTIDGIVGADEVVFGYTSPLLTGGTPTPTLTVEVPEPASLGLLVLALGVAGFMHRR